MPYTIAIDGPAGAGKSTIAKLLSKSLGFYYVDTGALYRGLAYGISAKGIPFTAEKSIEEALADLQVDLVYEGEKQKVYCNREDCTDYIRTPELGQGASMISQYGCVRAKLLDLQRNVAKEHSCVMDGRDIGTVVLPNANKKFFLTASAEIRAERRWKELLEKGEKISLEQVLAEVKERDHRDSTRAIAPLKKAEDAIEIDSSNLSINEVVDKMLSLCVGSEE